MKKAILGVVVFVALAGPAVAEPDRSATSTGGVASAAAPSGAFPLKVSANGRYLEAQNGQPWLMVGDSPQSVIADLSEANADAYLDDREAHGFNAVWINLLCNDYTDCRSDAQTFDGIAPFTVGSDPSTYNIADPNSVYFKRAHDIVAHAEQDGIEVLLDPAQTGGGAFLGMLEKAGATADFTYGAWLGNEFKDLPNIIWFNGNDFGTYTNTADDNAVFQVAKGIESTDPGALQTLELFEPPSSSLDDTTHAWASLLKLNGAYTYTPAYADVLRAYGQTTAMPTFLEESTYDGATVVDTATPQVLRLQEWWTMTSGAAGQLYGGPCYGITNSTDLASCDTTGVTQLGYQTSLLRSVGEWYNLAPDQSHELVTAGFGSCPSTGSSLGVNCVTAAETPDHTLALVYLPQGGTITVNLGRLAHSITARWFDPTNDRFAAISGSPFANSGTRQFTPPGDNSAGDPDWVLVLQAPGPPPPPPSSGPPPPSSGAPAPHPPHPFGSPSLTGSTSLPRMTLAKAKSYVRQTLKGAFERPFMRGVHFVDRCKRTSRTRFQCATNWSYTASHYYGKVTVWYVIYRGRRAWTDHYTIHRASRRCYSRAKHRSRCTVQTTRGTF